MSESVKEKIIRTTLELLKNETDKAKKITVRLIAEKAGVTHALINYHFNSKKNLITICVQRIINEVIAHTAFPEKTSKNPRERVVDIAAYVFEFLFTNPAIARLSILGDLNDYTADCNSVKSCLGITRLLDDIINEGDKKIFAFTLVSVMQVAFLSEKSFGLSTGFALDTPENRRRFITRLVFGLYSGLSPECVGFKLKGEVL